MIHNHRAMGSEVRLAIRRLAKEPALALAAVLTLALGIGACTAMFSIVEAVLLKSMDMAQPQRLVVMWPQLGDTAGEFSYNAYLELSRQSATFERVALSGSANWPVPVDILLPDGRRTRATQCAVSDTFFDVLGARPLLGRTFRSGEDRPGAPLAIVVSAAFWKTKLGGDPAVVGRTLAIGRDGWRIIGVMPPEFFYPAGADFWTPAATLLALTSDDKSPAALEQVFNVVGAFHVLARLKPGVSVSQAQMDATRRWNDHEGIDGRLSTRRGQASPRSRLWNRASRAVAAHGRGRSRARHRVRECRWTAGRPQRTPLARARRAARPGRDAMAAGQAKPSRGRCARRGWRHRRHGDRGSGSSRR